MSESIDAVAAPQDAPRPFSSTGDDSFHATKPSDLILRSSDGFDFHVHKDILKFASGCFEDMLVLAKPVVNGDTLFRDDKPVVIVTEGKAVLYKLLSLAYPRSLSNADWDSAAKDLDKHFVEVYRAADKYHFIHVEGLLNDVIARLTCLPNHELSNPHRLFAIGRILDIPALWKKSILSAIGSKHDPLNLNFPEMSSLPWADAQALLQLVDYYKKRADSKLRAVYVLKAPRTSPGRSSRQFVWFGSEHTGQCTMGRGACAWFASHIDKLLRDGPPLPHQPHSTKMCIQQLTPAHRAVVDSCRYCASKAEEQLKTLANIAVNNLDKLNEDFVQEIGRRLS